MGRSPRKIRQDPAKGGKLFYALTGSQEREPDTRTGFPRPWQEALKMSTAGGKRRTGSMQALKVEETVRPPDAMQRATGLVRQVATADQLIFNLFMLNLGLAGVYIFEIGPFARPQANLYLTTLIAGIGFSALGGIYALLSCAIPRTGGDYVFNTRVLGGSVGFLGSWLNFVVFTTIGGASVAWFWAHSGVPFALGTIVRASGSDSLQRVLFLLSTPWGETLAATCLIGLSTLVLLKGLATLMRIQRWLFAVGISGLVAVFGLLLFSSRAEFQARFDSLAGPGAYDHALTLAAASNIGASSWNWSSTLSLFPMFAVPALFAVTTNWFAGELSDVQSPRRSLLTMAGAVVVLVAVTWLLNWALRKTVGAEFLAAITALYFRNAPQYPLSSDPNYFHLASLLTPNAILACVIGLGWLAWCTMWIPGNMVFAIRLLFSWSVDGLTPGPLTRVSLRTHTPLVATIVVACLTEAFLLVSRFGTMFHFFVAASFMVNVAMSVTCFSAILFPFRLRKVYLASPLRRELAGIPVVSILGALAALTMIVTDIQFLMVREFGVARVAPLAYGACSIVAGIGVYYGLLRWRQSQGMDPRRAFAEIPPE